MLERDAECVDHGTYRAKAVNIGLVSSIGAAPTYSRCPVCMEESAAQQAEDDRRKRMAARTQRVGTILERAEIPPRFRDKTFASYVASSTGQRIALATCRQFAEGWAATSARGGSLVLSGGPGTGKTHLACAIAQHIASTELAVPLFGPVTALLRHIKATYRKDAIKTERQAIDDLVEAPDLLIIDEIGVQVGSDHEKLLLFEILNERYQRLKPTVLISNLAQTDLESYLGQRVMDRYRECGSVVPFGWESHRGSQVAA